ncbi:hypothetical protein [Chroococcidiopsis sp. CCNUC1]|nr:hypothetical protein [Chroococcidiopsis sp. CCNUC1]URD52397.1 hypothetical protein M5J74_10465 [Chroococcidiopsis sp. CCNUC1]
MATGILGVQLKAQIDDRLCPHVATYQKSILQQRYGTHAFAMGLVR